MTATHNKSVVNIILRGEVGEWKYFLKTRNKTRMHSLNTPDQYRTPKFSQSKKEIDITKMMYIENE